MEAQLTEEQRLEELLHQAIEEYMSQRAGTQIEVRPVLDQRTIDAFIAWNELYRRNRDLDDDSQESDNSTPNARIAFENIQRTKVTRSFIDDEAECSICTEKYLLDEEICELSCKHYFHEQCLRRWFQENPNCPMCRQGIQVTSN